MGAAKHEGADGRRGCPRVGCGEVVAAVLVLGVALACGSRETPKPSGAPMAQAPADAQRTIDRRSWKVCDSIPRARSLASVVRAIAKGSDPDGDPVEFKYLWRIEGRTLPQTTNEVDLGPVREGRPHRSDGGGQRWPLGEQPMRRSWAVGNQPPELVAVQLEPPGRSTSGSPVVANPRRRTLTEIRSATTTPGG